VIEEGKHGTEAQEKGTPQGGVISPLLANIALTGILEAVAMAVAEPEDKHGKQAVRKYLHGIVYADDLMIKSRQTEEKEHAETARQAIEQFLAESKTSKRREAKPEWCTPCNRA